MAENFESVMRKAMEWDLTQENLNLFYRRRNKSSTRQRKNYSIHSTK
jgi:hypothetical protein